MADSEFTFLGDALWLDFVNTGRSGPADDGDVLPDAASYRRWAAARRLRHDGSAATFADIRAFRDKLTTLAQALQAGRRPGGTAIEAINAVLASAPGRQQLVRTAGAWQLGFAFPGAPRALVAVAQSAASTLSDPLVAVRTCAAGGCSLFFTDSTPTASRRFCRSSCGRSRFVERRRGLLR